MGKGSFAESIIDSMIGGVIGAIIGIYYSKMIPEPTGGDYQIKLILSLSFVIVVFAPIRWLVSRREESSQESEIGQRKGNHKLDPGNSREGISAVLVCIFVALALGSFLTERERDKKSKSGNEQETP